MEYAAARQNMVENQVRANRVTDPGVVDAMTNVPREAFVPEALQGVAYADEDLNLGGGRHMMEPMVLGRLLQLANIHKTDVVLDIGCGTGYSSCVLSRMAGTVVALEGDAKMAAKATDTLTKQGADNVAVLTGPLAEGYPKQAPYDVIVINGAVSQVPEKIRKQLADGGRLVTVINQGPHLGRAVVVTRDGDSFGTVDVFDTATPLLPGFEASKGFTF